MSQQPLKLLLIAPPHAATSPALEHALKLTEALGASLRIVSFVHSETVDIIGQMDHDARDKARQSILERHRLWLLGESCLLRQKGLEVHYETLWGRPTANILAGYLDHHAADLVIKDLHEESALKRWVLSSLDWELLRACSASILFIKEAPIHTPLKFLAAVEIGNTSEANQAHRERIINTARTLAVACQASLHMMSVYDRGELHGSFLNEVLDIVGNIPSFEERKHVFEECAEAYGIAREHKHFTVGNPAQAIHGYIERCKFDLLVIGTVAKDAPREVLGHTAKSILGDPACSVLVLKPFAQADSLRLAAGGSAALDPFKNSGHFASDFL
jgi:universal stress protein E